MKDSSAPSHFNSAHVLTELLFALTVYEESTVGLPVAVYSSLKLLASLFGKHENTVTKRSRMKSRNMLQQQ